MINFIQLSKLLKKTKNIVYAENRPHAIYNSGQTHNLNIKNRSNWNHFWPVTQLQKTDRFILSFPTVLRDVVGRWLVMTSKLTNFIHFRPKMAVENIRFSCSDNFIYIYILYRYLYYVLYNPDCLWKNIPNNTYKQLAFSLNK